MYHVMVDANKHDGDFANAAQQGLEPGPVREAIDQNRDKNTNNRPRDRVNISNQRVAVLDFSQVHLVVHKNHEDVKREHRYRQHQ